MGRKDGVQTQETRSGRRSKSNGVPPFEIKRVADCDVIGHVFAGSTKMNQEIETNYSVLRTKYSFVIIFLLRIIYHHSFMSCEPQQPSHIRYPCLPHSFSRECTLMSLFLSFFFSLSPSLSLTQGSESGKARTLLRLVWSNRFEVGSICRLLE